MPNTHTPSPHTPGPWFFYLPEHTDAWIADDAGNRIVSLVVTSTTAQSELPDNARLIAAAPDLLAALRKLVRAIDRLPGNNPLDGLADEARAAIAAATGEPTA